jgi:flagellar export protein FliJ
MAKKKFRFRFETVQKVRKSRENETLKALADAQRAFQQALSNRAQLGQRLLLSLERRESFGKNRQPLATTPFQLENSFIAGTKQRIIQAEHGIQRARRGVEKALRAYLHARRQTKIIESIRDKDYAEYRKAMAKKEQKELDDLYVMRARLKDAEKSEGAA